MSVKVGRLDCVNFIIILSTIKSSSTGFSDIRLYSVARSLPFLSKSSVYKSLSNLSMISERFRTNRRSISAITLINKRSSVEF